MSTKTCEVCGVNEYQGGDIEPYSYEISEVSCFLFGTLCTHCRAEYLLKVATLSKQFFDSKEDQRKANAEKWLETLQG